VWTRIRPFVFGSIIQIVTAFEQLAGPCPLAVRPEIKTGRQESLPDLYPMRSRHPAD
jgi:hypothetical protein